MKKKFLRFFYDPWLKFWFSLNALHEIQILRGL